MIELRNLSFRYSDGEPYIIKDLDLIITPGECMALTGLSGCGKTTLVKLLLGLLEPTDGEILVGGVNLTDLGLSNYRRMIGTVMQEDTLFAGSVSDNITFFSTSPNQQQINESAKPASIDVEIMSMPMGSTRLWGISEPACPADKSNGYCWHARYIKTRRS